ncbi:MAG: hypothetical protein WDW38_004791 [Sanguina aurantia]
MLAPPACTLLLQVPLKTPSLPKPKKLATQLIQLRLPSVISQVIKILPNNKGVVHLMPQTAQQMGLHPRDVSLFTSDRKLTPQRATITVRDGMILFKTEAVSAIISADKALLITSRRKDEKRTLMLPILQAIKQQPHVPFEMSVLEVLLHSTTRYFERRIDHISLMMEHVLGEFNMSQEPFTLAMVQQLVPLEKVLTAVRNDVKETCEAINKILEDDDFLASICLTEQKRLGTSFIIPQPARDPPSPTTAPTSSQDHTNNTNSNSSGGVSQEGTQPGVADMHDLSHTHSDYSSHPPPNHNPTFPSLNRDSFPNMYSNTTHSSPAGHGQQSNFTRSPTHYSPAADSHHRGLNHQKQQQQQQQQQQTHQHSYPQQSQQHGSQPRQGSGQSPYPAQFARQGPGQDHFYGPGGPGSKYWESAGYGGAGSHGSHGLDWDPNYVLTQEIEQASRILETYGRELESVVGGLLEMEEEIDTTRETWRMQLDSSRNHFILTNLWISMISISLMLATIVPTFFGMNIEHGLENTPFVFWGTVAASAAIGVASYPLLSVAFRRNWKTKSRGEVHKVKMLRLFLMQHLDELEEILEVVKKFEGNVDQHTFRRQLLKQALCAAHAGSLIWNLRGRRLPSPGGVPGAAPASTHTHAPHAHPAVRDRPALPHIQLSRDSTSFLFEQLDTNRDGVLTAMELLSRQARPHGNEDAISSLHQSLIHAQPPGPAPAPPHQHHHSGGMSHPAGFGPGGMHAQQQQQLQLQQEIQRLQRQYQQVAQRGGNGPTGASGASGGGVGGGISKGVGAPSGGKANGGGGTTLGSSSCIEADDDDMDGSGGAASARK